MDMKEIVDKIILETQDDIWQYLNSDVPLENYQSDIDEKFYEMRNRIYKILEDQ